jgi:endonuclease YncB( thermonuclease family)
MRHPVTRRLLLPLLAAALVACGTSEAPRYSRKAAQASLGKLETPGLALGEFRLTKVIDGDTIRVDGLDSSLRLLALDTEETFKNDKDRRAFEQGWEQYLALKRGNSKRPIKAATPMGEAAYAFAKQFFEGVELVRLERDNPREIRDRYDRYLAYVFAQKNGTWVNFAVESVRAGMSPYFSKYGYSRRFHEELVAAEREARAARRGIWDPATMHYPDYDIRKPWWTARAEFIAEFDRRARGRTDHVSLTDFDALARLERLEGQEVTLLATVGEVRFGDRGPSKVMLSRKMRGDFPIVFFDKDVLLASGITRWKSEYVMVRGVVTTYVNKRTKRGQLQIVVERPGQVILSDIPGLNTPGEDLGDDPDEEADDDAPPARGAGATPASRSAN